MGHLLSGRALDVRVLWASHHVWPAAQEYNGPCYGHALWLMLKGEAEVSDGEHSWNVGQGTAFFWPKDKPRRVITPSGANWLSLGLIATTPAQVDILGMLPLPALHPLETTDYTYLQSWLVQIIDIRNNSAMTMPAQKSAAKYFETISDVALLKSYDKWMDKIVADRPPHYDVIEDGLARAVVAWCWGLWGPTDLEQALLHHAPRWLQNALERIHENPAVSVHDLARSSGFSPAQFRRSFHQKMGQSPRDYLQHQRLEFAKQLLETTDLPISSVAAQTGFASVPHFVQLWKQSSGLSPLQYRLSRQASGSGKL